MENLTVRPTQIFCVKLENKNFPNGTLPVFSRTKFELHARNQEKLVRHSWENALVVYTWTDRYTFLSHESVYVLFHELHYWNVVVDMTLKLEINVNNHVSFLGPQMQPQV